MDKEKDWIKYNINAKIAALIGNHKQIDTMYRVTNQLNKQS